MTWTANLGGQIRHTEIRGDGESFVPAGGIEKDLPERGGEKD